MSPALAGGFFTTDHQGSPGNIYIYIFLNQSKISIAYLVINHSKAELHKTTTDDVSQFWDLIRWFLCFMRCWWGQHRWTRSKMASCMSRWCWMMSGHSTGMLPSVLLHGGLSTWPLSFLTAWRWAPRSVFQETLAEATALFRSSLRSCMALSHQTPLVTGPAQIFQMKK